MSAGTTLAHQPLSDTPASEKIFGHPGALTNEMSAPAQPRYNLEPLLPSPMSHTTASSVQLKSDGACDSDASLDNPQCGDAEDKYTLTAYGDMPLGEIIVPPLLDPTPAGRGPLQPRNPHLCLRLKVQRPPMPKRRLSCYVPDPLPRSEGLDLDERWPGSAGLVEVKSSSAQHQPLVSPFPVGPTSTRTQEGKAAKKGNSSLEKLFNELLPRSPSIRLSPPGSPANQALGLPRERHEAKSNVQQGQSLPRTDDAVKRVPSAPWRTRLPPRLPIPKWDM